MKNIKKDFKLISAYLTHSHTHLLDFTNLARERMRRGKNKLEQLQQFCDKVIYSSITLNTRS